MDYFQESGLENKGWSGVQWVTGVGYIEECFRISRTDFVLGQGHFQGQDQKTSSLRAEVLV